MTAKVQYTTQLQAGLGLPRETRLLLRIWEPGMTSPALYQAALRSGDFPNVSARRLLNIIRECFAPRYLVAEGQPARYLKQLAGALAPAELNQLFFLYTCRANQILADFVREVFWERYAAGDGKVTVDEAKAFVRRGVDDGKNAERWSDGTVKRVTSYLLGCCTDCGLLGKRTLSARAIIPYRIEAKAAAYLAHDLHFAGLGNNALLTHQDWQLFGLAREDVRDELKRLSLQGHLILQSAGEITQQVLAQGCEFLLVCLPASHALPYEWVGDFARTGVVPRLVRTRWTGKQRLTDTYGWLNALPLRDDDDALHVGWCELTTTDTHGQVLYRNAWASSQPIREANVVAMVEAAPPIHSFDNLSLASKHLSDRGRSVAADPCLGPARTQPCGQC